MLIHQNNLLDRIDCHLESNFGTDRNCFNSTYSKKNEFIKNLGHVWNKGGIYLITDFRQSKILYVGKTGSFQSRLKPDFNTNHLRHEVYKNNHLDFKSIQVFLNPTLDASYEKIIVKKFGSKYNRNYNYLAKKKETLDRCMVYPSISLSSLESYLGDEYREEIIKELIDEGSIYLSHGICEKSNRPAIYVHPNIPIEQLFDFLNKNKQCFIKSRHKKFFTQALSLTMDLKENSINLKQTQPFRIFYSISDKKPPAWAGGVKSSSATLIVASKIVFETFNR